MFAQTASPARQTDCCRKVLHPPATMTRRRETLFDILLNSMEFSMVARQLHLLVQRGSDPKPVSAVTEPCYRSAIANVRRLT